MRHTANKIPKDWVYCPKCGDQYGFIKCRVTTNGKSQCLSCKVQQDKLSTERKV